MNTTAKISMAATVVAFALAGAPATFAQQNNMTFFVTSVGLGKGADLGGVAGADAHCQALAQAAGAGGKTWHAYLSIQAANGQTAVNAKDRIGHGPWTNAKGALIAKDIDDLHKQDNPNMTKATLINENGGTINGRGDTPNTHDALTGTQMDGTAFPAGEDRTCGNWTSSGQGSAMLGHIDRTGLQDTVPQRSWNSAHPSRGPGGGCSQPDLVSTGGAGLFYCFATN